MPYIDEDTLKNIKTKIDITDLINQYINLENHGNNFKGLCPFHNDSNPSLNVSKTKQLFKCFSCNIGGDCFKFLQKYKNISFIDSVIELAKIANVTLNIQNQVQKKVNPIVEKITKINSYVQQYTTNMLQTELGTKAKNYLINDRKLNTDVIQKFKIGFCPKGDSLINFLNNKKYTLNDLKEAGLLIVQNNAVQLFFQNRIIFPIFDLNDNITGFSGRAINNQQIKYINTSQTAAFTKQNLIFNFNNVLKLIPKIDYLIITEGYLDVIRLDIIGVKNAISLMGVNLSIKQISQISQYTKNIYLFLDSDDPGKEATIKMSLILMKNFNVKILQTNSNLDPDAFILKNPNFKIEKYLKTSEQPLDFVINYYRKKFNFNNSEDILKFKLIIKPFFVQLKDLVIKDFYIKKISEILNISSNVLKADLLIKNQNISNIYIPNDNKKILYESLSDIKMQKIELRKNKAENIILWQIINSKKAFNFSYEQLNHLSLKKQMIITLIKNYYENNPKATKIDINYLKTTLNTNKNLIKLLNNILYKYNYNNAFNDKEITRCFKMLILCQNEKDILHLISKKNNLKNKQEILSYTTRIKKLQQQIKDFK